ncbi:MAG: hypothetical protein RLZZ622_1428, partial [Planctomycetota bacterium]
MISGESRPRRILIHILPVLMTALLFVVGCSDGLVDVTG